jgi:peptidoglycan/LPS O-acetylase OafA/YrhL
MRRVSVPPSSPWWQQLVGLLVLIGLVVGVIIVAIKVGHTAVRVAAGAVLILAAFVLIVRAAAALRTGLGPKQLLQILKEFFSANSESQEGRYTQSDASPAETPSAQV